MLAVLVVGQGTGKDYPSMVAAFREAIRQAPTVTLYKDLGYALGKMGDLRGARNAFEEAMKLAPEDVVAALEFAYLANDLGERRLARRIFQEVAAKGSDQAKAAFTAIDSSLADDIQRATAAVQADPNNFSVHEELARLAEDRSDDALARQHYRAAITLKPDRRDLLVALSRVDPEASLAALIAASRGPDPRTSETAQALLPQRYPYVSEFQAALQLDPSNIALRKELAYLHLAMQNQEDAPPCTTCGSIMVRSGSCYKCSNCGTTSGCA